MVTSTSTCSGTTSIWRRADRICWYSLLVAMISSALLGSSATTRVRFFPPLSSPRPSPVVPPRRPGAPWRLDPASSGRSCRSDEDEDEVEVEIVPDSSPGASDGGGVPVVAPANPKALFSDSARAAALPFCTR